MPKYLFAYHGGSAPSTPEEGEKSMAAWMDWFKGMGAAMVDMGSATGKSKTVANGGVTENGGANPVSGYSVVTADSFEAAAEIAKGCPMVANGTGSVEVAEMLDM